MGMRLTRLLSPPPIHSRFFFILHSNHLTFITSSHYNIQLPLIHPIHAKPLHFFISHLFTLHSCHFMLYLFFISQTDQLAGDAIKNAENIENATETIFNLNVSYIFIYYNINIFPNLNHYIIIYPDY